ncbi:flagellar assembly protein FliH [Methylomonas sp. MED-D]|uniref:flagellar assembly protein FliH n=1 Tax=unclassified Methylomonas TaxID=2608980 RepID=UPI0014392672|nr:MULTISPECIES: flagellar assembly protein FliH [unclassified Methylomonas]MDT4329231.1 flagellar assembly protein FliH [Methylomonas sp. MV1]NJA07953.1 flagellar assembly protein FliH [Methylococcaceae bacterium WWC4]WGS87569.1 flagellar assembly protein FliH [Methylomonas sp. UP202]
MNSSKGNKFSDAELQALNRWTDLQDFSAPRSEPVDVKEATETLTVDQIEAIQKQAYAEAYAQGRQQGMEEGREIGLEEGRRQGYEESLHLLQKQAAELNVLLEALSEPFRTLDAAVEEELVKLACAIAGQLVRRELKTEPGEVVAVVREAVKALPLASQKITVNLHPEDAALVRTALSLDESMPPWCLREDPLLSRGGCTVETEVSSVDASVETRLAAVIATVLGGERRQDTQR